MPLCENFINSNHKEGTGALMFGWKCAERTAFLTGTLYGVFLSRSHSTAQLDTLAASHPNDAFSTTLPSFLDLEGYIFRSTTLSLLLITTRNDLLHRTTGSSP
jgi:hypothetical protein